MLFHSNYFAFEFLKDITTYKYNADQSGKKKSMTVASLGQLDSFLGCMVPD